MEFSKKIVQLRKEKAITQEELAEMLSVSRQAVSKWEAGKTLPDLSTLMQIADYFNISLDELMGRAETEIALLIRQIKELIPYADAETTDSASEFGKLIRNFIHVLMAQNIAPEQIVDSVLHIVSD